MSETQPDRRSTGGREATPGGSPLLIVSNRGPVEYYRDRAGAIHSRRAGGGLATALAAVAQARQLTWVASPVTQADREMAGREHVSEFAEARRLRLVSTPRHVYDLFYGAFCNPLLWFLQHSLWHALRRRDPAAEALASWAHGYLPVNEAFGEEVADELLRTGARQVMLHDYHLYHAPEVVRRLVPDAALQHFVHIPWPSADEWAVLPRAITESLCRGLLANDSVVFQTGQSVRHFVETCATYLRGASAADGGVRYHGRRTRVWANPISVDVADLRARLASARARPYRERLAHEAGERTIVRVDRLDPSKNVIAGFQAFDAFLHRYPRWKGRVRFLAFLVPSRASIPEYRAYTQESLAAAEAINTRHGRRGWQPVQVFHENNRLQALAAMSIYDVLLVNPYRDGMNLVSKEGPVVNERDGVLVLSRTAGAYGELEEGALPVEPEDVAGTAEAIHAAIVMPLAERRRRAAILRRAVELHDLEDWLRGQLDDLRAIDLGHRRSRGARRAELRAPAVRQKR
jgi:trehalose 6-phosphate synthase